jgi:hypothetical protein
MPATYAKAIEVVMEERRTNPDLLPDDKVLENYEVMALLSKGEIVVYVEVRDDLSGRVRGNWWTYTVDPSTFRIKEKYRQK